MVFSGFFISYPQTVRPPAPPPPAEVFHMNYTGGARNFVTRVDFSAALSGTVEDSYPTDTVNGVSVTVAKTLDYGYLIIRSDNSDDIFSQEVVWRNLKPIAEEEYHAGIPNLITAFGSQLQHCLVAIQANSNGTMDLMQTINQFTSWTVNATSTVTIDDQNWNSFIITRDSTGLIFKVYINAVLAITHTYSTNPFIDSNSISRPVREVQYGRDIAAPSGMDFNTYHIKIWRATLSQADVTAVSTIT